MADTTEKQSKLKSRKFIVWIVWGVITTAVVALGLLEVVKNGTDNSADLIKAVLGYFFGVSMLYLGVNVGQKIGLNLTDYLSDKSEKSEVYAEEDDLK